MSSVVDDLFTLRIEKPVVGGRMLARHGGRVILVAGAVPGEEVRARLTRVARGVAYADTTEVLLPSPDRRETQLDLRCGGSVLGHITPTRQRLLKAQIVADALLRLGRVTLPRLPDVVPSPEEGYRMRARFHVRDGRLCFYRDGSHDACDPVRTGQLLPATGDWIAAAERALAVSGGRYVQEIEMVEDLGGQTRVCHCDLAADADLRACARLAETTGLDGMSVSRADRPGVDTLTGSPAITDVLRVPGPTPERPLRLTRNVQAFFQGNRFLIEPLVAYVASLVPPGPVIDLYAGVGLFGLALSAAGAPDVTLVEGDTVSGADLARNAEPMGDGTRVVRQAVEAFLASTVTAPAATVILDPPRSGLSKAALAGLLALGAPRVVYVSCDASTLARDARLLLADGYDLDGMRVFDLFPNTAHVETVARFSRT